MPYHFCDPTAAPHLRDFEAIHHSLTEELAHIREYHAQTEFRLSAEHLELIENRPLFPQASDSEKIWQLFEDIIYVYRGAISLDHAELRLLRTGVLFSTMALLESWLMDVCLFCTSLAPQRLTPRHIRQEGLRKMIVFLEGVCGVDLAMDDPRFAEILAFSQIKNIFAHHLGSVEKRGQLPAEVAKIVSDPALCVWSGSVVVLQQAFCMQLIISTERFGRDIAGAVALWIKETVKRNKVIRAQSQEGGG
jgi:hypothetical protein